MDAQSSLDLMLFRSRLADAQETSGTADQLALAELCLRQGERDLARMLYETAFILQGSSRQALAAQATTAQRTGLWPAGMFQEAEALPLPVKGTIDIAIAELEDFARLIARRWQASSAEPVDGEIATADIAAIPNDAAEIVAQLHAFLRAPAPAGGWIEAEALLRRIRSVAAQGVGVDHRTFHAAELPLLAAAMSFAGLRDFVLSNQELLSGAGGSAEVLHRTARFDSAGLGPYLGNLARIANRSREVFELARCAATAAGGQTDETEVFRWVGMLTQYLKGDLRNEVVDDLGDLAASTALMTVLERAARKPEHLIEMDLIFRLRDAAIDIGDFYLARRAQAIAVRLRPEHALERMILGSIEGTAGLFSAAEQSFLVCLELAPDFVEASERLAALRRRDAAHYEVLAGFGTPKDRALRRSARRNRSGPIVRAVRRRAVAVDL